MYLLQGTQEDSVVETETEDNELSDSWLSLTSLDVNNLDEQMEFT